MSAKTRLPDGVCAAADGRGLRIILHWPQVKFLFGRGREKPDWSLQLKSRPLPWRYVTTMLGGMSASNRHRIWRNSGAPSPTAEVKKTCN
jgi:hypothetical protein